MEFEPFKIGKHTIEKPIVQGGMGIGISWDRLTGNVSKEGGLGVISTVGTGYYKYPQFSGGKNIPDSKQFDNGDALKEIFIEARRICGNKPLAANVMHALTSYKKSVVDACEAGADIIICGAGMPLDLPDLTQNYPSVALVPIIRDVRVLKVFIKKWLKNYNRLPDAVVLEGPKSGGHQGFDFEKCELPEYQLESTLPDVIELAKEYNIPVIVAGGIWNKNDIEKFISMGASAVQMGTRFVTTIESDASYAHKNALLNCTKQDISLKQSPVGFPSRSIDSELHKKIKNGTAPKIICKSNCVAPCNHGEKAKEVGYCIADRLGDCQQGIEETGLFFTGTNGYKCNEIISVKELIKKLMEGE